MVLGKPSIGDMKKIIEQGHFTTLVQSGWQQVARGRQRIAIFYGAAHMADFDERLRKDFDLQPVETTWVEAWNLRDE